ncbi:response regulator [[Haemophilus] felis]|uniref:Aerobic respiration control sensor protein n=1 Tax=[Haemophilus] felis TaxID=123822 RepID=A0A1T0BCS1_9PAST|nr:response regulator [[Haemophilus] felis]OOS07571.1 hybrid sensor histidine kinase/response regulator [[Haemophilus] felis]
MRNLRYFAQKYVDWVIRLGRVRFSLLGLILLALWALCTQVLFSWLVIGEINWLDMLRSIVFGLISAPVVIYFFTVLVEKLEYSRQGLARLVSDLRNEVSERIAAEKKLSVALDNIEQTSRDKTRLMATISHELRTPLNGIIGLSRILLEEELSQKQRNYLKTINVSAVSLGHIFSDIIDLEKIDTRRIELNVKETELNALLNDIGNFANLMAEQKKLTFQLTAQQNLPHWIMIDYARLSQILWNLISNAVKFTQKGMVNLQVYTLDNDKQLIFQVSDTGIGISKTEQSKIFNMYYQVESAEYKPLGSGIGLAVAKSISQLMGGDLSVESELGKGTTFKLHIPLIIAQNKQVIKAFPIGLNVLLVEDIEVNVIVAKSVLEKLGYKVDVAMSGRDAIKMFEQKFYDLVLLDIQLPDISGFHVAQKLRQGYEEGIYDALPPLVALTANVMSHKVEYQQKGVDDVLRKPLALEELSAVLSDFFPDSEMQMMASNASNSENSADECFDYSMLKELIDVLGITAVKNNLRLLQQMMPEYISELLEAYQVYQKDHSSIQALTSSAHKIKGALGSIGLKKLSQIATLAQDENNPNWHQEIGNWVQYLNEFWRAETISLEKWLEKIK